MRFSVKILTKAFLCILVLSFFSCGKIQQKVDPKWYQYIKGHTSGTVSKKTVIRVLFNQEMVSREQIGKKAGGIISFSPGISGKAEWASVNELVFVPEGNLDSGQQYRAEMDLSGFVPEKDLEDFFFTFQTIKQNFDFYFGGLSSPDLKNLRIQEYSGTLNTADITKENKVESILKAYQEGKELEIHWKHESDRRTHNFTVKGIVRKDHETDLTLKWDGSPVNVDQDGEKKIAVPAKTVFKVTEIEPVMTDEQFILIRFSDPLEQEQNILGLIRMENQEIRLNIDKNMIRVYPEKKLSGNFVLAVEPGIRNSEGKRLTQSVSQKIIFESVNPGVRWLEKGTIIPKGAKLTVPFEAVNVHSVQVTALRVYSENMGQFLQVNRLEGDREIKRVGRYLWRKTIELNTAPEIRAKWSRYYLDLSELFKKHPNSLFRLSLSINRGNSAYRCGETTEPVRKEAGYQNWDEWKDRQHSNWDYYQSSGYYDEWKNRKDPCHDAYYNPRFNNPVVSEKNFISSNIGIIAKQGENKILKIATTNILTAEPVAADIKVYNFQNVSIGEGSTDSKGMGEVRLSNVPFYLTAKVGDETGYLKLNSGSVLPTSHFDVGGTEVKKGVKGAIYGERGIWRPGDTLYLTFVLNDENDALPENHPLHLELYNPQGQLIHNVKDYRNSGDFYLFEIPTEEDAPTGNWQAVVRIGGLSFKKNIKIETIVPNRLKVNLDLGRKTLYKSSFPVRAELSAQWLHGANAGGLKADVKVRYSSQNTQFSRNQDFEFDDITRSATGGEDTVFDGRLDDSGKVSFNLDLSSRENSAGMLHAHFTSRVFEEGGGFSTESIQVPYHPYSNYAGIKTPKGDAARGMILTDKEHTVDIATLNDHGNPVSLKEVEVTLYKVRWKYWWDKSGNSLANFASDSATQKITSSVISTRRGAGKWKMMVKYPNWGRYLIRACDLEGGHCSSKIIYIDWPGWAGRAREEKGIGATRLNFTSDKKNYRVGEKAVIYLPEAPKARALVSLETGSQILNQMWVSTEKGENKFSIQITREMAPNVYVHVSLIQPHQGKDNDRPIRLYGVIPLMVEDPSTRLNPVLSAPDVLRPSKKATFRVREEKGRPMTYTLSIVDEGLLGLTGFQTPDLHNVFYSRESLGIKSWDLFDDVTNAYGGRLERILSIGGGDMEKEKERAKKRRFPPVVKVLGPFRIKGGESKKHIVEIPAYIGAVRVMVVAGEKEAFGSADKSIQVKEPLMVLATLPRVLGPGESLEIPVTLFSSEASVSSVEVNLKANSYIQLLETSKTVRFEEPGEQIVFFKAKTVSTIGKAHLEVQAKGGGHEANQAIYIDVRSPNPVTSKVQNHEIAAGKRWEVRLVPHGIENTNSAAVEISTFPPINLEERLRYLIRYPHGCIEQTVSSVFPQIYLSELTELTRTQKDDIQKHVEAAIQKLRKFQLPNGGFTYWPGRQQNDDWGSNYAGHFLLEAKKKGYYVPPVMLNQWKEYQRKSSNSWKPSSRRTDLIQAYRLYTLALAQIPELGAMNRLRERNPSDPTVRWQLASAFFLAGQMEAAEDLVTQGPVQIDPYFEMSNTYGSHVRDKAIILSALTLMGKKEKAGEIAREVSQYLASDKPYSTQTTAYSLMSLALYYGKDSREKGIQAVLNINGKDISIDSEKPVYLHDMENITGPGMVVRIKNNSKNTLFATLTSKGSPAPGQEEISARDLEVYADYFNMNRQLIDVQEITQGQDFMVSIQVRNPSREKYENMVLSYIIPSGWQLRNLRFEAGAVSGPADYQDIRDDRVYTYFPLKPGESKRFTFELNASFQGRYYLPGINVEAMYKPEIHARLQGKWVEVTR